MKRDVPNFDLRSVPNLFKPPAESYQDKTGDSLHPGFRRVG